MSKLKIFVTIMYKAAFLSHLLHHRPSLAFTIPNVSSSITLTITRSIPSSCHYSSPISAKSSSCHPYKLNGRKRTITQNSSCYFTSSSRLNLASSSSSSSSQREVQQTLAYVEEDVEGRSTPRTYFEAEQTIKKSRFIGIAKHCTSWEEAQEFIKSIRDEHPKARHACFGFVCGTNPVQERCSDDGEPTGTAGPPILGGINGEELSDTVCVVVRYSGGIKLGAGGLIRAYGGTARLVLREAERDILIPKSQISLCTSSSNAGVIYATATRYGGVVEGETYNEKGDLIATITCDTEKFDAMVEQLTDATRGGVTFG